MEIKIMGPGCPNCQKLAELVQQTVEEAALNAEIKKVSDFAEMARAGVLSTPALTINGEIKCVGRVPGKAELKEWLK